MKRKLIRLLALVSLLLSPTFASAHVVVTATVIREIRATLSSLFDALKSGNVQVVRLYLSDREYERRKGLFEQNSEYPAFLQNFYRGATVRIGAIQSVLNAKDDVIAEFIIKFPAGDTINTRMRLTHDVTGRWIVQKYLAGNYDQGESSGEGGR